MVMTPQAWDDRHLAAAPDSPRTISIFGSTGSVGCSTLELVEAAPAGSFQVAALTANQNVDQLVRQSIQYKPKVAVIADPARYQELKQGLAGSGTEAMAGPDALVEAAGLKTDWVMASIVGAAGLQPALAALSSSKVLALANKECLVCAGELFMSRSRAEKAAVIPVDSEHNAIFQVFDFNAPENVEAIILTASGGPFRTWTLDQMENVTPSQAIAHPNWSMGNKISVDSATMMNKGLEMIEAFYLFPVSPGQIETVVHPQSVVHSFVKYVDGSVLAQLGQPDMRTPISHALAWPRRMATSCDRLDFKQGLSLSFDPPDENRFPAIRVSREALYKGGLAPTILNAANEVAVKAFLGGKIGFLSIAKVVELVLQDMVEKRHRQTSHVAPDTIETVLSVDAEARVVATEMLKQTT